MLKNFPPAVYQNKGKVWKIASAPNGIIYGAADGGLLEYDGKTWNSFKGSSGFTRSVLVVNDSLIYTGSDLDFGAWRRNKYMGFEYTSLYPFKEDLAGLSEEFWQVHRIEEKILFVSSQNIYIFRNDQLTKISAPSRFTGSFFAYDTLYFADEKSGLFILDDLSLRKIYSYPDEIGLQVVGIFKDQENVFVVSRESGLFRVSSGKLIPVNNSLSQTLKNTKVFCFELINNTYPAFGTVLKGLLISDLRGNIIHQINKNKGLPNNTVLSLHYCSNGILWMGMDYGISSMNMKTGVTYFFDYRGDFGTGYSALLKNGTFYLGTNQGLYQARWDDLNNRAEYTSFQIVPGTEGQVWTLEHIDDKIFMGHDKGLFIIEGITPRKLSSQNGVWTIIPYRDYILAGTYNGICVFRKYRKEWVFDKRMDLILGSCNQLVIENDNLLWVNIPNFGVIRAVLNDDLYPVDRLIFTEDAFHGHLPSLIKNGEGIYLITDDSQYNYDPKSQNFLHVASSYNYPNIDALLPGVYKPITLHPDYEFFPIYNGFALKYLNVLSGENHKLRMPVFRKLEVFNNYEAAPFFAQAKIPSRLNNLRIQFIVPNQDEVYYQFKLKGSDDWSPLRTSNYIEFYNLKFGAYNLMVRASVNGNISDSSLLSFKIEAPWYQTWYAYMGYILLVFLAVFIFHKWKISTLRRQKKDLLKKEKKSLNIQAEKHRQEIILLEQERLKSENELIKQQLRIKTIDLANKARDNEEKNRVLVLLKEKFEIAQNDPARINFKLKEIQKILDAFLKKEDKTFEIQMDELHQDLFSKLKEKYPDLSIHDLRMCAYLKIGLNTKEIADIFNILPSSAFISRSRLRKKLKLDPEEDLHAFLNSFSSL